MGKLGVIARCDEGGLGTQTWEYVRHLDPDRVLVVLVDPPRGVELLDRYDHEHLTFVHHPPHDGDMGRWRAFVEDCDVILTAESTYLASLPTLCRERGTRLVNHANPELWAEGPEPGYDTWAPTAWNVHKLPPGTPVVPVPVDRARCVPFYGVREVRTFLHVSAPAMRDRNGTELVKAALPHCQETFNLLVSGPEAPVDPSTVGKVTVYAQPSVRAYWRLYVDVDAFVLPRRYGGLCLPMQEAASRRLPIVALSTDANRDRFLPDLTVHATGHTSVRMRGGAFPVHRTDPAAIAERLDLLVREPEVVRRAGVAAEEWASSIDWHTLKATYEAQLDA